MPPVTRSRSSSLLTGYSSSNSSTSYPEIGPSVKNSSGFIFEISRPSDDAKWFFSICDASPGETVCFAGENRPHSVELVSTGSPEYTRAFLSRNTVQKECYALSEGGRGAAGNLALVQEQMIPAEDMALVVQQIGTTARAGTFRPSDHFPGYTRVNFRTSRSSQKRVSLHRWQASLNGSWKKHPRTQTFFSAQKAPAASINAQ